MAKRKSEISLLYQYDTDLAFILLWHCILLEQTCTFLCCSMIYFCIYYYCPN